VRAATLAADLTADEHVPQLLPSVLFCAVVDSKVVGDGHGRDDGALGQRRHREDF
jgi:hypothetical protein